MHSEMNGVVGLLDVRVAAYRLTGVWVQIETWEVDAAGDFTHTSLKRVRGTWQLSSPQSIKSNETIFCLIARLSFCRQSLFLVPRQTKGT